MSIDVRDLITKVRKRLHEPDAADSNYSDEDLLDFINDATDEIFQRVQGAVMAYYIVGDGGRQYPLPENLLWPLKVTSMGIKVNILAIEDTTPWGPLDTFSESLWGAGYGAIITSDSIHFMPALGAGEQRVLHYIGRPPMVEDADGVLEAPQSLRQAYIFHTLESCMHMARDQFWSGFYRQKFEMAVKRARHTEAGKRMAGRKKMRKPNPYV